MSEKAVPRALQPPAGRVAAITRERIAEGIRRSRESPRRRVIVPFHRSHADRLHRMLNVVQPGTYVQPHRHLLPPKAEAIVVLQGAVGFVAFSDAGAVEEALVLRAASEKIGVDLEPGVYHTFVALEPDTVLFEVKPGPYEEASDKDFAPWAPPEGSEEARAYLARLEGRFAGVETSGPNREGGTIIL